MHFAPILQHICCANPHFGPTLASPCRTCPRRHGEEDVAASEPAGRDDRTRVVAEGEHVFVAALGAVLDTKEVALDKKGAVLGMATEAVAAVADA